MDFVCNDRRQGALQRTAIFAPTQWSSSDDYEEDDNDDSNEQIGEDYHVSIMTMTGGLISSRQIGHSSSWHPPAFCTSLAMSKFSTNLAMIIMNYGKESKQPGNM